MNPTLTADQPKVSVIIPAYNQAEFLPAAIESVLAQTYRNFEIIVIDDGSTDNTSRVAQNYIDRIQYIYQSNIGLAGTRNTGIRCASGEYIGLLDSDDSWMENFLETMLAAAAKHPQAAVLFSGALCMDTDGNRLPQRIGFRNPHSQDIYTNLVRANFIIPSTVILRREAVLSVGMFDQSLRSLEDWDLWLRMLPRFQIIDVPTPLAHYRVHGGSLSANLPRMQASVRAVVEKNFGPETVPYEDWDSIKKQAYAGLYRYNLLSEIQKQNNWQNGHYLLKALQIDRSLAKDDDLFYDLGIGNQPVGYRDMQVDMNLVENERKISAMLATIFNAPDGRAIKDLAKTTYGSAYKALALIAYNTGRYALSRKYTLQAFYYRPDCRKDTLLITNFIKSFLGKAVLRFARRLRRTN